MHQTVVRASRATSVGSAGMLVQDKFHGLSLGHWVYLDVAVLVVSLGVVLWTWEPFARRLWWRKPKLELRGVGQFFRSARDSRSENDLQVVYARFRNVRNGGGQQATLVGAEAWMTMKNENGRPVGHGCQGNWVNVQAGTPDPTTFKQATLRPNGEQYGLEIAAKFLWAEDAYLAGEVYPNLPPGRYTIGASISDAVHKAAIFEWVVVNPGANDHLTTEGLPPRPPDLGQSTHSITEVATASAASATQTEVSVSWGGTALRQDGSFPGVPQLIEEEGLNIAAAKGLRTDQLDFDALRVLRRKGLDLLSNNLPGVDGALFDRAATEWIDDVRRLTEKADPGFASYFVIPEHLDRPRWQAQSRRMRELVQRLAQLLAPMGFRFTYASYGLGDDTIDPLERLNARIKDDRINFIVDKATMGGDPVPRGQKTLILRWMWNGEEFQGSYAEGTHVGLPD